MEQKKNQQQYDQLFEEKLDVANQLDASIQEIQKLEKEIYN